jgi:hypothetical protein
VRRTWGRSTDPVAVVLPGAGSTAEFVTRAFGPPLAEAGYALVTADLEAGPDLVPAALAGLDEAVRRYRVRLAGGVSLGAQLAVRWAAGSAAAAGLHGLLLALPAWSGPPGAVAAVSAVAAAEVEAYGVAGALARAGAAGSGTAPARTAGRDTDGRDTAGSCAAGSSAAGADTAGGGTAGGGRGGSDAAGPTEGGAVRWVLDELAAAWPRYGANLPAALRAAAGSSGPTRTDLARVGVPAGLAAFVDDPLHPLAVAEQWAATLRWAAVERLRLADPGGDRAVLGAATLRALRRADAERSRTAGDPQPYRGRPVTRRDRRRG